MLGSNGFFIFSTDCIDKDLSTNKYNYDRAIISLIKLDINFKLVDGFYKYEDRRSIKENSFVVGAKHENLVLKLAKAHNQESVLYVDGMGNASLFYLKGKIIKLGKFKQVSGDQDLEAYTYDASTDTYWAAV